MAIVVALWIIPWKGVALWKAAQKKDLYWFIALLFLNTMGILEILYIFVFSKMVWKKK
jgi:methionyl-tRNA synthetase